MYLLYPTESDPDPKDRKMSITFYWLCELNMRAWNWNATYLVCGINDQKLFSVELIIRFLGTKTKINSLAKNLEVPPFRFLAKILVPRNIINKWSSTRFYFKPFLEIIPQTNSKKTIFELIIREQVLDMTLHRNVPRFCTGTSFSYWDYTDRPLRGLSV